MMSYDPDRYARRSIRMRDYDYAQPGAYFVTICTYQRECLLGAVVNGEMLLNEAGKIVRNTLEELSQRFPDTQVDVHMIMPNHLHGVILVGAQFIAPIPQIEAVGICGTSGVMNHAPTVGEMVRIFKAISTRRIRTAGNSAFAWQRNYYEHVIRDEAEFHGIRQYIIDNPKQWGTDQENPRRW